LLKPLNAKKKIDLKVSQSKGQEPETGDGNDAENRGIAGANPGDE
jgi:hypothetical protein